jgi:phosphoglycolate phosphatase-like HAD superfamily hydrolase
MPDSLTPWLEVLNPRVKTGRARYALFDFDGTISVIRREWERIMVDMMIEMICGGGPARPEIAVEAAAFVDRSTGVLTILQMKWLAEATARHGLAQRVLSAGEYKRIFNERLLGPVRVRLAQLDGSLAERDGLMIAGARAFLQELHARGVRLFLASGTDHEYVVNEAGVLGVLDFFEGRVFGARGESETDSKEQVIQRILAENRLAGEELLVVGDGPVEIRAAHSVGAVALGVAADEETRATLNPRKRARLVEAGADLLVANFLPAAELAQLLCGTVS